MLQESIVSCNIKEEAGRGERESNCRDGNEKEIVGMEMRDRF